MTLKSKNKPQLIELAKQYGLPTEVDGKDLSKADLLELIESYEENNQKDEAPEENKEPEESESGIILQPDWVDEFRKKYPSPESEFVSSQTRRQVASLQAQVKELQSFKETAVSLAEHQKLKLTLEEKSKTIKELRAEIEKLKKS